MVLNKEHDEISTAESSFCSGYREWAGEGKVSQEGRDQLGRRFL